LPFCLLSKSPFQREPVHSLALKNAMSADQPSELARLRQENERLCMERDILKKVDRDLCRDTDMSFRFIEDYRDSYPVRLMCAVPEIGLAKAA
jgi:hypothetical protein